MDKLTKEEKAIIDARVEVVEAAIKAAAALRKANKVEETKEVEAERELQEAFALKDAKGEVTDEERMHWQARQDRINAVVNAIAAAKLVRDENEKNGIMETPGATIDREAKEAADLKAASVLKVIENFSVGSNIADVETIEGKVNEIIDYLNRQVEVTKKAVKPD